MRCACHIVHDRIPPEPHPKRPRDATSTSMPRLSAPRRRQPRPMMCQAHTPPGAALRTRRRSVGRRPGGSDETGAGGRRSAGIGPSPTGSRSRRGSRSRPRRAGSTRPRHRTRAPFQRAPARRTRRTRGTRATSGRRRSRSRPTHVASGAAERQGPRRASRGAGARRDATLLRRRVRREEPRSIRARLGPHDRSWYGCERSGFLELAICCC